MTDPSPSKTSPALVRRALSVVTEVRDGEVGTALLLTLNVFLLLTAYYVIKPVREALILELESGAEYKSYASAAIAVLLLFVVPLYARFANRVARNRLVVGVTLFFASHLVGFYALEMVPTVRAYLGFPFYLWVGIFNMMVVAQFWAFANDVYTLEQGKRLFPLIGIGASIGAALGAKVSAVLVEPLGVPQLMLVSAVLLAACAGLTEIVHLREHDRQPKAPKPKPAKEPASNDGKGAFAMVLSDRYLRYIALFSVIFTVANSNGEFVVGAMVSDAAAAAEAAGTLGGATTGEFIGRFYGDFYFYVNVLGVFLQMFVVSRLVKWAGLDRAFFVLPVIMLISWSTIAIFPLLAVLRVGKTVENGVDYSINNTVRQLLWLPTTAEAKYKAKQAIDTFFVRTGDVISAVLVAVLAAGLGLSTGTFAVVNVVLSVLWIAVGRRLIELNHELSTEHLDEQT